ncbi:LysR family transcriptional regulator [Bradyrhizobium oligotrophicum]|uniref:LysR family transcriptional regulator n=1 Tax=Bradyrhizobium oligotrophicum TaxID=44255 RepID=UPI003EBF132A
MFTPSLVVIVGIESLHRRCQTFLKRPGLIHQLSHALLDFAGRVSELRAPESPCLGNTRTAKCVTDANGNFCFRQKQMPIRLRCMPRKHIEGGMERRHLRYFIAVAEEGRFLTAAQRRLNTLQPFLSRQIRVLNPKLAWSC